MHKSDLCVIAVIYGVCGWFAYLAAGFPPEARTYPQLLLTALAALNTAYLAKCLWRARRTGLNDDLAAVFSGFRPRQFWAVALACLLYLILMYYAGFYVSGAVFLPAVMWYLRVPWRHIALTVVALAGIIYAVFTVFLKVPLPRGQWWG